MGVRIEPSGHRTPKSALTDHTQYHEALPLRLLAGHWPDDLEGHVFFTSPDIASGIPVFGSDGMIYRFDLLPSGPVVRSASLRTPSGKAAERLPHALGMPRGPFSFRKVGLSRLSPALGAVECLNVAPTPIGDRMWVTSDAGRPWEIDPASLRLLTPVGARSDWRSVAPVPWVFPLLLTSGHPAIDPDGETAWEVNFSNLSTPGNPSFFRLLRVHHGQITGFDVIDEATGAPARIHQSVHQMACTEHHIVMLDSAFHVEARQLVIEGLRSVFPLPARFLARLATEQHAPHAAVWVIPRAAIRDGETTVRARRYLLDEEATHFAAAWNEPEGSIKLVILHTPCQDVSEWIRQGEKMVNGHVAHPDLVGMTAGVPMAQGCVGVHLLHPDGRVTSERLQHDPGTWGPALYTLPGGPLPDIEHFWYYTAGFAADALPARMVATYRSRLGEAGLAKLPLAEGRPSSVVHVDLQQRRFDVWSPPQGWGVFGLCFVPRRGGAGPWDGYLFASALSDAHEGLPEGSKGDEIWIFDAQKLADGPICRLGHPDFNLPFTLHSAWLPRLTQRAPPRVINQRDEHDPEAAIAAWAESLAAPAVVQRGMRRLFRCLLRPDAVGAFLDEHVWERPPRA